MPKLKTFAAGLALLAQFAFGAFAQSTLPPSPPQKIALNPITNKVYVVAHEADAIVVYDIAAGTNTPVSVGDGPLFIAVNPVTNRVYVNNSRASSLTVIDGATNAVIGTYPIGSSGPIAINPVTNVIYVVRMTGVGTDEVTYFDGNTNTWYTIATQSFQPTAVAANPVTNKIAVAHYGTGNLSIIDGAFNPSVDHPTAVPFGMWSKPFAVAVNPVTNKYYVITEDSRGPIAVLNGADNSVAFLATGTARIPKAVAVNPVTNKAYALFSNELIVVDGANAIKSIPVADSGTGAAALGINTSTNRILVATAAGGLTVVNGSTDTVFANGTVPSGTAGVALNPVTGRAYFDVGPTVLGPATGETAGANPLVTTIAPFAGNASTGSGTFTFNATSGFAPNALPIRRVYYQVDSTTGPWIGATGSGTGPYTASFSGLAAGSHTVRAFAVDGLDAPLATGSQSSPVTGTIASYTFTVAVTKVNPTVSLASSGNPANVGSQVTFTASVSGSAGTPTGTVTFRDGSTAICSGVGLSLGSAACVTSTLTAGTHAITTEYSGDANYNGATSSALQQQMVARATQTITFGAAPTVLVGGTGSVSATSTSGNPVTFTSLTASTCSVSGSTVTGLAPGTCTIAGNAAGNATYDPAPQATQSFPVVDSSTLADLAVSQSRTPDQPSSGKDVMFTYEVINTGVATANNVVLQNAAPAGATFVWATPECSFASNVVTCNFGSLPQTLEREVRVVWRFQAGSLSNTVTASTSTAENTTANNTSVATASVSATPAGVPVQRYRLYSDVTKEHHFTTDLNEYTVLGASGNWVQEGTVGRVLDNPGSYNGVAAVPYYRLYDQETRWHHWTTDANEYYTLIGRPNWDAEGVDGYILPTQAAGTIELYRLTYPFLPGLHHWTTDPAEYQALIAQFGWIGEPGAGFVVP
jgi:uncharacterized repeat protein (TIGR01451 family)